MAQTQGGERWMAAYRRRLDRDVAASKFRQDLDAFRRRLAENRRGWERLSVDSARTAIDVRRRAGLPVSLDLLLKRQRHVAADVVLDVDAPYVTLWRSHVAELTQRMRVDLSYPVFAAANAYAWPGLKRIEAAPINGASAYATVLHEFGHVAQPCRPPHQRVDASEMPSSRDSVCVQCELLAWVWAIEHARPAWTRSMHGQLASALTTYRPYGTSAEQAEIDAMVSPIGFRSAQIRRARREGN